MLSGIKVLDLSRAIAGPYCAMLLGDLGATVIKVEPPEGDLGRAAGLSRVADQTTYFVAVNRNKRSIVLDLSTEAGRGVLGRLVAWADVLVENFRPGVLERLGFNDEHLKALNPKLIVCSISGYGQIGPYRDRKALDLVGQTMGGLASVTGSPDGPPTPAGAPVSDVLTGLNACISILAALLCRERTGEQPRYTVCDVTMIGSTLSMLSVEAAAFLNTGKVPQRHGGAWFEMFPYDIFPTRDGWIAIGAGKDWGTLCTILGLDNLAEDDDLNDMDVRVRRRQELKEVLSSALRRRTTGEWLEVLQAADILSCPVYALDDVFADPRLKHLDLEVELSHPVVGTTKAVDSAFRFTEHHGGKVQWEKPRIPPPMLGEHSIEILRDLGYSETEIADMCRRGDVLFLP